MHKNGTIGARITDMCLDVMAGMMERGMYWLYRKRALAGVVFHIIQNMGMIFFYLYCLAWLAFIRLDRHCISPLHRYADCSLCSHWCSVSLRCLLL
jgi:hypothetical protein